MGKKKSASKATTTSTSSPLSQQSTGQVFATRKLSQPKRNELNQVTDQLLKLCFDSTSNPTELWKQYNEIQTILQRIQLIESELKTKTLPRNRNATIAQFYEWSKQNHIKYDFIRIAQFPGYELGLEATKDFASGEQFVIVPKQAIMSLDNLSTNTVKLLDRLPVLDTMANVKLALGLMVERIIGADSKWKSYIDLLPDKYPTVMNFTPQEMNELKGTSAFLPALYQCKNIARQYAFIRKAIFSLTDTKCDAIVHLLQDKYTYELYW